MNILFWNIMKIVGTFDNVVSIVEEEEVDIIAIAEMPATDKPTIEVLLNKLNAKNPDVFKYLPTVTEKEKVVVYYRKGVKIKNDFSDFKLFGKQLEINGINFGLVFCHLPAAMNGGIGVKEMNADKFRKSVEKFENEHQRHQRTIVCGDFNMNPFESGMVDIRYFNAVMDKKVANKKTRKLLDTDYNYFYNPMWGCLGDNGKGGFPGTYYYNSSEPYQTYWNILDQVIIRPDVIPYFDDSKLKIITKGTTYNLLTAQGHPNKKISDHLPIIFTITV